MNSAKSPAPFYTKLAMVLVSVICLFYIAILGKNILAPLLFALLFSVLLLPVARLLEKKLRIHRSLAAILSVILLMVSIAIILYIVVSQIMTMADDWPQFKTHLLSSLKDLHIWISFKFHINTSKQNSYINNLASQLLNNGPSIINDILSSISSILLYVLFTLVDTFFLLYYRRLLVKFLISVFREEDSEAVYDIIARVQLRMGQYIQGLLLELVIVSTVSCLALWMLGVDYPILLGLLTGLLNLIPYIGILISLVINTLIAFTTAGVGKIVLVIATQFGIHLLDANLLLPLLVGAKVRLNALITIIGVIVGGSAWGIAGAFLAVPVIAIIKIIFDRIENLQPWGILLGDERDEKSPASLKLAIKKEKIQVL